MQKETLFFTLASEVKEAVVLNGSLRLLKMLIIKDDEDFGIIISHINAKLNSFIVWNCSLSLVCDIEDKS